MKDKLKDRHVIWSNYNLDYEDWRADMEEFYPYLTEEEQVERMYELNNEYLDDERINLNVELGETILVIADLGLWNGRKSGYKEIYSGNISDCLYCDCDYAEWYIDRLGDFRCACSHHDGNNDYLYRVYKSGVTEEQKNKLKEKIYNGTATRSDITKITRRLGDDIAKVYGFRIFRGAA